MIQREREAFARRHPRSRELHERARGSLLAGVPMSWMAMWAGGHPIYLAEAEGARLVDVDGNSSMPCASSAHGTARSLSSTRRTR